VNFLLHRHFALAELDSLHAGVGAMLPDLWRMADRRMRARTEVATRHRDGLQRGVAHHLEADMWFHRTRVFRDGERELARAFASVGAVKLVLFAHPAWEMCLDGALLAEADFDEALGGLRHALASVAPELSRAAALHGAEELPDGERFAARMARICAGLADGEWIGSYRTGDGLVACIDGMRRRFSLPSLDEEQGALTACILEEALDRARDGLAELTRMRRVHLAEAS
jgi:hypothetical protein